VRHRARALAWAYSSLPPPKCANGQYAPTCGEKFGPRGTKLDLKQCQCIPICPAGKDYYAASHFWPNEKCLTKSEYQVLKPQEYKEFEKLQDKQKQSLPPPVQDDDGGGGIMTTQGSVNVGGQEIPVLWIGVGVAALLVLFMLK